MDDSPSDSRYDWPEIAESFDTLNKRELIKYKYILRDEILSIEHQLDMADARNETTGEYIDPHWVARATMAMKSRERYVEEITELIGLIDEGY